MVRNAKLVGQSIISYLQKKGYPEVSTVLVVLSFFLISGQCNLFLMFRTEFSSTSLQVLQCNIHVNT